MVSIRSLVLWRLVAGLVLIAGASGAWAQGAVAPDKTLNEALGSLTARAGAIFAGQVVAVKPRADAVEVQFQVETPVLGPAAGLYTLREWKGLWVPGVERYRVGERCLVFLYGTSGAGLGSPVDGMEGVVPERSLAADTEPLLDVRWLATRLQRPVGTPLASVSSPTMPLSAALTIVGDALAARVAGSPLRARPPLRAQPPRRWIGPVQLGPVHVTPVPPSSAPVSSPVPTLPGHGRSPVAVPVVVRGVIHDGR